MQLHQAGFSLRTQNPPEVELEVCGTLLLFLICRNESHALPDRGVAIRVRLELAESHRDLALFNMAIDSKLRGCDLVKMKVVDVMASGQIKERAYVLQSKIQKPVRFEISEGTQASVEKWMEDGLMVRAEYLWPGRFHERLHISTRQYARIVRDWVTSIGLEASAYGTHSMRRTKVTQIYKMSDVSTNGTV